jgi:hypothetical protein
MLQQGQKHKEEIDRTEDTEGTEEGTGGFDRGSLGKLSIGRNI